ncbi:hypothetical protein H2200_001648 [Cladophialophora chaetospira]|uniref:Alpha/beta hydrolase fold-3 domain-containing protein n=1 Tax=Cladophialophora chaetospira TaxID=386627 RepID=A0AA38XLE2_9EURO|nr:hypothetical protein H2200_001648 [Cladophialophora chaetospira]
MATQHETPIQKEGHSSSSSTSPTRLPQKQKEHPEVKSAAQHGTPSTTTTTAGLIPQSGSSSIEVTMRNDLSLLYRVIRSIIKPLRPRLVSPPKKPYPGRSPKLDPPKKRNIVIKETEFEHVWMYHLHAFGPDSGKQAGVQKAHHDGKQTELAQKSDEHTTHLDGVKNEPRRTTKGRGFERRHRVYYFCGGGFQGPPSGEHWRFLAQLAQDLAGHRSSVTFPGTERSVDPESDAKIELILVSYPLAPKSPASESLRVLRKWLRRVMDEAVQNEETLGLMGDSSGANIAMSLGFWAVEEYDSSSPAATDAKANLDSKHQRESQRRHFPLTSIISISGPMDLTNSSPEVPYADKLDCVLTADLTMSVANIWCGHDKNRPPEYASIPLSSPEVSPLFHPDSAFQNLKSRNINIHGVYGTHDVLAPSGIDLMKKCQKLGVKGRWLVWEGQMHCFPLAAGGDWLGIREGREARKFIETVLRGDAEMED